MGRRLWGIAAAWVGVCGVTAWAIEPSQKAKEAEAAARLEETTWVIAVTRKGHANPTRSLQDTLRFQKGTITSERWSSKAYPRSNYTLWIGEDEIPVWETMQTNEGEGIVFWRGELHGDTMQGAMSQHPLKGKVEDYSFVGRPAGGSGTSQPSSSTPSTPSAPLAKGTLGAGAASPQEGTGVTEETTPPAARKGWFGR